MEIQALNNDQDRAEIEEFFATNISQSSARVPLLPRANDPHRGYRSHILVNKDASGIVAALHAAPPILEVAEMSMTAKLPQASGQAALENFVMLYSIATRGNRRREGHAQALLNALELRVQETTASSIYGVCASDSVAFYEAAGYTVLSPSQKIRLTWGDSQVDWPIEGDAQWFIKTLR